MLTTATPAEAPQCVGDTTLRIMQTTPGVLRLGKGARTLYWMPKGQVLTVPVVDRVCRVPVMVGFSSADFEPTISTHD